MPDEEAVTEEPVVEEGHVSEETPTEDTGHSEEVSEEVVKEDYEARYKELQSTFTTKSEENARLNEFLNTLGGKDAVLEKLQTLNDPAIQEFLTTKSNGETNWSEEQRQAAEFIDQRAKQIADQQIKALTAQIAPQLERQRDDQAQLIAKEMDSKHPGWRDCEKEMLEISKSLSPELQANPTLSVLEDLHLLAMHKTGRLEKATAESYKKKLEAAKSKAISTPSNNAGNNDNMDEPKNFAESVVIAKRILANK